MSLVGEAAAQIQLLNTFADLRSGVNIGGFFAPTSANSYWVFAERFNGRAAAAETTVDRDEYADDFAVRFGRRAVV